MQIAHGQQFLLWISYCFACFSPSAFLFDKAWKKDMQKASMNALQRLLDQPKARALIYQMKIFTEDCIFFCTYSLSPL